MLLIGVVIGAGLGSVSTFMQRLTTPSEFDALTARILGSVSNADSGCYPVALPVVVAAGCLYAGSRNLDVLALGREMSTNLGVSHKRASVAVLVGFGRFPCSKGRLTRGDERIISRYIDFLGLGELEHRYLGQLSCGQRQRAYVAVVLCQETGYVLLDEPTTWTSPDPWR